MKITPILLSLSLAAHALAQTPATPVPKKDPFAGFGNSSLDRKPSASGGLRPPAAPAPTPTAPANAEASGTGLTLDARWDTRNGLSQHGPLTQRRELRALLTGFAQPGKDTSPQPGVEIYGGVTYLMPLVSAQAKLGLTSQMQSGGSPSTVGIPPGLKFTAFTVTAGRKFAIRFLIDRASQVVAVEFVANDPRDLPPLPGRRPDRSFLGKIYDFLPQGSSIAPRPFSQFCWHEKDDVIIATRYGPASANLHLPKPFVSIMLYCLDLDGDQ